MVPTWSVSQCCLTHWNPGVRENHTKKWFHTCGLHHPCFYATAMHLWSIITLFLQEKESNPKKKKKEKKSKKKKKKRSKSSDSNSSNSN